ncbi:alpha/beta hydrolase [Microtetraspora sp. NBRC 16547]|uniref:alpha/beta fold hydrolase n=1 Tax=Microtetraspora sp. NBRC 16547 TaxID=3030993 RepID=UPI0024A56664|nr:alpha/beta hydrolase [Microtetraspora sp. NBRC 16547]GLW96359.1 hydrolase [Microtetraspora sp. NBRC 16547]
MELTYERRGTGPPLVLLHGIGHHWQAWSPVLDLLADRHDVIAVDFPGFGASPPFPPDTPYNVETAAFAVEEFWEGLGLSQPHVAGNSLGGYVALDMASRGVVRTAVALSPAGFWSRTECLYACTALRMLRKAAGVTSEGTAAALMSSAVGRTASLGLLVADPNRMADEEVLLGAHALRNAAGFDEMLDSFTWLAPPAPPKVPITIAWGDHDRLLPRRQAVRAGRWAQQRVKLLTGCGHVPMSDDPALVARIILETTSG